MRRAKGEPEGQGGPATGFQSGQCLIIIGFDSASIGELDPASALSQGKRQPEDIA